MRKTLLPSSFVAVQACVVLSAALVVAGCQSSQQKAQKAIDQATAQAADQAAKTGQPQQVVSVDQAGNTTTTVVQPPAPGQAKPVVTTTVAPPAPGAGAPKPAGPTVSAVPAPPPPRQPVNVNIPSGTTLAIRVDQSISVKSSHAGDRFTGEIVDPILTPDGSVLVPKGTPVAGVVDASHRRGHFKGASVLELRLTSMTLNGKEYPVSTRDLARTKKGKGKRTAAFIGGGSGLGMLVGGLATGGVGVLAGGLAGAGAGTAAAGLTGNRDLVIPAESVVHFKLSGDLVVQLSS